MKLSQEAIKLSIIKNTPRNIQRIEWTNKKVEKDEVDTNSLRKNQKIETSRKIDTNQIARTAKQIYIKRNERRKTRRIDKYSYHTPIEKIHEEKKTRLMEKYKI
jgi:hypothetical protein